MKKNDRVSICNNGNIDICFEGEFYEYDKSKNKHYHLTEKIDGSFSRKVISKQCFVGIMEKAKVSETKNIITQKRIDEDYNESRPNIIFGYCRVSTKGQVKDGYSLEVQAEEISTRYSNAVIELEQFTGKTTDRPVFQKMLKSVKSGDTVVVTKLDRLARNTVEGISIVQSLFDKGVSVHVLNVGLLENTSMGKFFLTTLLAVAEMERNTIIERTHAGKEMAKTKDGFVDGRPKLYTKTQLDLALGLLKDNSYNKVAEMVKISKSTIIREVRRRKVDWAKLKTKYEKKEGEE